MRPKLDLLPESVVETKAITIKTRIAPTPSGFLHIGNAVNFVLAWLVARAAGGTVLLRIDDLDAARKRPEYVEDVFRTLDWLKIDWDEGPQSPDEFESHWSQQHRLPLYKQYLQQLLQIPDALFACQWSRNEIIQRSTDGQYPEQGRTQNLSLYTPDTAWRVTTPTTHIKVFDVWKGWLDVDLYNNMRHFVVKRRDELPAYQLTSLVDDVTFDINFIVRGNDLLYSSAAQRWLANLLTEEKFLSIPMLHHPLISDAAGNKLSKSHGAESLRNSTITPAQVYKQVAKLCNMPPCDTLNDLLHEFALPALFVEQYGNTNKTNQ